MQRSKISYILNIHVFSFKMFRSELLWRLFTLTSMTISVSGDGSTVWRHAPEWRRDFRAFSTMTSWLSYRFYYSFTSSKKLILFFIMWLFEQGKDVRRLLECSLRCLPWFNFIIQFITCFSIYGVKYRYFINWFNIAHGSILIGLDVAVRLWRHR